MVIDLPPPRLPEPGFQLADSVGRADAQLYQRLTNTLDRDVIQGGTPAGKPSRRMAELVRRIEAGERSPEALLRSAADIRLLISWWRAQPERNLALLPLSGVLLERCEQLRPRFSLQALFGLIHLFFDSFDRVAELEQLASTLLRQLQLRGNDRSGGRSLAPLILNRRHLFRADGPEWVVKMATSQAKALDTVADAQGIPSEARGRYYEVCQQLYYLETLDGLEVGDEHPILHELARSEVNEAGYRDGLRLGHEVIRRIVDKASGNAQLPDNWLHLVLGIAGDPRVSVSSARFTRWWALLGPNYSGQVRRWLSRMDLRLFLEVLEDYSNQAGDEMQRMYPARERFLRGLFDAGLIGESRLFLSRRADAFVRQHYRDREVPDYATNSDAERSVFYLNVGGAHVFEGTHNFYFWVYRELPANNPSANYETDYFPIRDLGMGLKEWTESEIGQRPFHVAHHGDWQHGVINELRSHGIEVDPRAVLTDDDYRLYRRRHGVY